MVELDPVELLELALGGSAALKKSMERRPVYQKPKKDRLWILGLGPVSFKPGETKFVDVQPKVLFRTEKIVSHEGNSDMHLSKVFVGRKAVVDLHGDTIDLGSKREIALEAECHPALPIQVEVTNRGKSESRLNLSIFGVIPVGA